MLKNILIGLKCLIKPRNIFSARHLSYDGTKQNFKTKIYSNLFREVVTLISLSSSSLISSFSFSTVFNPLRHYSIFFFFLGKYGSLFSFVLYFFLFEWINFHSIHTNHESLLLHTYCSLMVCKDET